MRGIDLVDAPHGDEEREHQAHRDAEFQMPELADADTDSHGLKTNARRRRGLLLQVAATGIRSASPAAGAMTSSGSRPAWPGSRTRRGCGGSGAATTATVRPAMIRNTSGACGTVMTS